jgi:ATP-dependent 26S proteasome regulatory subunit
MKLPGFVEGSGIDATRPDSLGVGKSIDLNAVAAVTEGCSGADLEQIVNEAAIRTARRVSVHLKDGVPTTEVDVSILPEDIEESIKSFFQARSEKKRSGSARSDGLLLFGRQNSSVTLPKL